MSDSSMKTAIKNLWQKHKVPALKVFLDEHQDNAKAVIDCFLELHNQNPYQKVLNFLDQVLLPNQGHYEKYEAAMTVCKTERILPKTGKEPSDPKYFESLRIDEVRYMIDGALPADLAGRSLLQRFTWAIPRSSSSASNGSGNNSAHSSGNNSGNSTPEQSTAKTYTQDRKAQEQQFFTRLGATTYPKPTPVRA